MELLLSLIASLNGLNCLYFALLLVGGLYATIILFTGALHDINLPHVGLDLGGPAHVDIGGGDVGPAVEIGDTGTVHVPSLSPITVASFVTAFGAFGIIATQLLGTSAALSLLWAAGGGLIVAILAHFAFGYFLIAPQGSSEVRQSDVIGATAEVITPIPAGHVGEIALIAQGGRVTYSARSVTGEEIPRGQAVVVENLLSNVALVRPVETARK